MWVDGGCRGIFECDRVAGISCASDNNAYTTCACDGPPAPPAWEWGPTMNTGRWYHAVATLGGSLLYASGGFDSDLNTLASVEMLDVGAGTGTTWAAVAPMLGPRARHAAASIGNLLYIFGGCSDYGCTAGHVLASVEVFYPGAQAWIALDASAMPAPRSDFGVAVLGSSILLLGGSTGFPFEGNLDTWKFEQIGSPHPYSGAWSNATSFPTRHESEGIGPGGYGPMAATASDDAGVETSFYLAWDHAGWKCVGTGECFG